MFKTSEKKTCLQYETQIWDVKGIPMLFFFWAAGGHKSYFH